MKYKYHKDGTHDKNNIFVFGSNLRGVHGAGAAKYAYMNLNASWGKGVGCTGATYAIPTKDEAIRTLPLDRIKSYVDDFIRHAQRYPELEFWVTRIGCGLAGYEDKDIAPMFVGAPENCNFPEEWREFVEGEE